MVDLELKQPEDGLWLAFERLRRRQAQPLE